MAIGTYSGFMTKLYCDPQVTDLNEMNVKYNLKYILLILSLYICIWMSWYMLLL